MKTVPCLPLMLASLVLPLVGSPQINQSNSLVTCGSPNDPTSDFGVTCSADLTGIPAFAYPLVATFYVGGGCVGGIAQWFSQDTLLEPPGPTYESSAGVYSEFCEGGQVQLGTTWDFRRLINNDHYSPLACGSFIFYTDALEQAMFDWTLQAIDCAAGSFRLLLTDEPDDPGDVSYDYRSTAIHYLLFKNGAYLVSGSLWSLRVPNTQTFALNGLTAGTYQITLTDYVDQDGYVYCPSSYSRTFTVPAAGDCNVNVAIRASLQGALPNSAIMTDALRSANLIPLTEPYSALGYTYTSSSPGASVPATMLVVTGNDAIVDWIVVELRDGTTPSQVVYSKAALIQRDGDVVGTDGDPYVNFPVAAGNYYVALRHRNHLGVMTGSAQALGVMPETIDFQRAALGCFGTNPRTLAGSVYCLWSGDGNGNGTLQYVGANNDRDPILTAVGGTTPNNTLGPVYDRRDVNLDGVIKYVGANNDRDPILTNVGSTTPNNTRMQQLP
jgi:hypothetical protein